MLRTRLGPLARARTLHTAPVLHERAPTFTTPAPASPPPPPPLAPASSPSPSEPLSPLPPTNLPVEDYASPLLHTASFFSSVFRYAVFGSVGIVTVALSSLVAVHLYVEHSALALPATVTGDDDPDEWIDDAAQGWSAKHLERRGGTDPRLGLVARAAVRGAWISMNWTSGSAASPLSQSPAAASTSKFAVVGPRMIGQDHARATRGTPVADSGWLMAEQYLVYALAEAQRRGISLVDPADWERQVERGGVDRAAGELEERLAGVRERIGGRIKLEQARDGWQRIHDAIAASPTTDVSTDRGARVARWERREQVLASRKLGELGGRIAELWGKDSDEGRFEAERARAWFVQGLTGVLDDTARKGHRLAMAPPRESEKHVSPASSFFSFWSRSHPPSNARTSLEATELSRLVELVTATAPASLGPSTARTVLATLVSLETFLARTASDLAAAHSVQTSALGFARLLAGSSTDSDSPSSRSSSLTTMAQVSRRLTSLYLATRISALETHLAECELAALQERQRGRAVGARSLAAGRETALRSELVAQVIGDSVLVALAATGTNEWSRNLVGVDRKAQELVEEQGTRIRRDADKVAKIAQSLIEFLEK